ncbi:SET and MYND domain-containing protein DDB_G0273589-like [Achroia grisella]|uniref:SET and MYND domain-containing protein DDB_G0273589-like n=1 Tax=Achroia grisella TaxID=688607 RepID=UPI0027D29B74|nr:SET and MYND domain-containing protein DDB_G0273589-like [Achroia grisella]
MNGLFGKPLNVQVAILAQNNLLDKMYDSIGKDGTKDAVMVALDITRQMNMKPQIIQRKKDLEKCRYWRNKANSETSGRAIKCYNGSLLYTPITHSKELISTYRKRAELLFKLEEGSCCMNDIDIITAMGCPPDKNINMLRQHSQQLIPLDQLDTMTFPYFQFPAKRNKSIPYANANISIVREDGVPKVVAARNIRIGELVAIEPAFVAVHHKTNRNISCYNCFKFTPSLIPCETCCYAMFCTEACRKQCLEGYHKIECQIMDVLENVATTARRRLSVMAALKIRQMSKSWEDVVTASRTIGTERMKNSSDDEIFDCNNPHSILSYNDYQFLIHGKIFNQSFIFATVIDSLSDIPDYFPTDEDEQLEAMHALGRIMLHLYVTFPLEIEIQNWQRNCISGFTNIYTNPHIGFFLFTSKLKHSCEPNLLEIGLNNKVGLVAIRPIKKGTELNINHRCPPGVKNDELLKNFFINNEFRCHCSQTARDESIPREIKFNNKQVRIYRRWENNVCKYAVSTLEQVYSREHWFCNRYDQPTATSTCEYK